MPATATGDLAHGGSPHAEPELITIAPDMLRDLRVTIGKVESRAASETVTALGELRVDEEHYAEIASPVTARVAKVLARPGDVVTAGQVLVELTSPELGEARAAQTAAQTRLDVARETARRKDALAADQLITERERLEAAAARSAAEADYTIATAALRKFGGTSGATGLAIKSPIAGTVIDRTIVLGQLADPMKSMFRVGDLSTLWLVAHVFERDAVRVQEGRSAIAAFAALPGQTVPAIVRAIGREVDPSSRTIAIRLDVPNPDGVLRPGMSATAAIPLGTSDDPPVLVVPAVAVQRVGAGWAVFIPHGPGAFEARPIGRGRDLAGDVEVVSGLQAGEQIVLEGAFLLKAEADKARGGGEEAH